MFEGVHESSVHPRRARRLAELIDALLPEGASVLDVGCGDGKVSAELLRRRSDLQVSGLEVHARSDTAIPVDEFDGHSLPVGDRSVDVVLMLDVLHHTEEPSVLLREAARVASRVVIKDHVRQGLGASATLRFMDRVGNLRHGVDLPHNYLSEPEWRLLIDAEGLLVRHWVSELGLYPWPASLLFDRSLHCLIDARPKGVGAGTMRPEER